MTFMEVRIETQACMGVEKCMKAGFCAPAFKLLPARYSYPDEFKLFDACISISMKSCPIDDDRQRTKRMHFIKTQFEVVTRNAKTQTMQDHPTDDTTSGLHAAWENCRKLSKILLR
jgi:hypothetical protein